jgi:squalene synthase HpnC
MNSENAYKKALIFAKDHYENFPVVSFLIRKELRKDVAIIYWFARTADDLADEGNHSEKERLENLEIFENRLTRLLNDNFESEFDLALAESIKTRNLNPAHFYNLLKAFKQDVVKKRYAAFSEVKDYCKNSANPVGRLILELHDIRNEEAFSYSDDICTALQLTNFYQDTAIDFEKGRIYYPLEEMEKFKVVEKMFRLNENNSNLRELVKFSTSRTKELFNRGKNLLHYLDGCLKMEIKWTILGGEKILGKIEENNFDVIQQRPIITKIDFIWLIIKSFLI